MSASIHTVNQPCVHMCQDYFMHWLPRAHRKLDQVWMVQPLKNHSPSRRTGEGQKEREKGERERERVGVRKGSSNCTTYSRNSAQSSVTSFSAQSSAARFIILLPSCLSNPTTHRM